VGPVRPREQVNTSVVLKILNTEKHEPRFVDSLRHCSTPWLTIFLPIIVHRQGVRIGSKAAATITLIYRLGAPQDDCRAQITWPMSKPMISPDDRRRRRRYARGRDAMCNGVIDAHRTRHGERSTACETPTSGKFSGRPFFTRREGRAGGQGKFCADSGEAGIKATRAGARNLKYTSSAPAGV
jgi:hypothetical protein